MQVKFLQAIAGYNPDGTALFIDAHEEHDYPDGGAMLYIGMGVCEAVDPKEQEAALKKYAKLKKAEAETATLQAENLRKIADRKTEIAAKAGRDDRPNAIEQRARAKDAAKKAEEAAHEKWMEEQRALDNVRLAGDFTTRDFAELEKKSKRGK